MNRKYCSIVIVHYSQADDFGSKREYFAMNRMKIDAMGEIGLTKDLSRSTLLRKCMESLEKNTDYPAEIIVIDNGGKKDDSNYLLDLARRGVINTYIRNKKNMHFAHAFNMGAKIATGDYICLTCNDIYFKPGWLSACIKPLEEHPERKIFSSPLLTPDKNIDKYKREPLGDYRVYALAGSMCMVLRKKDKDKIGDFSHHRIAGTFWSKKAHSMGYLVTIPPEDLAIHTGMTGGLNINLNIKVTDTLLKGQEVDSTYFDRYQRTAKEDIIQYKRIEETWKKY